MSIKKDYERLRDLYLNYGIEIPELLKANGDGIQSYNTFRQNYTAEQIRNIAASWMQHMYNPNVQTQQNTAQNTQTQDAQIGHDTMQYNNNTAQNNTQPQNTAQNTNDNTLNQIMDMLQKQQQQINQLSQNTAQPQPQPTAQPQPQPQPHNNNMVGYSSVGQTNVSIDYSMLINRISDSTMDKLLNNILQQHPNYVLITHRPTNSNGKNSTLTAIVDIHSGNVYKPKFVVDNQTGEPDLKMGFPQQKRKFIEFLYSGSSKTGKNPYSLPNHTLTAISNYLLYHC